MAQFQSRRKTAAPKFEPAVERTAKLSMLNKKKPEWDDKSDVWTDLYILFNGGYLIRQNAMRFLRRRPKEDSNVFSARVDQVTYQDLLGTGVGWYVAELFETDPEINIRKETDVGPGDLLEGKQAFYYNHQFLKNSDGYGNSYVNFWRNAMAEAMVYGEVWVLTDLPQQLPDMAAPKSLQEQRALGLLDPYLVHYAPTKVINYQEDDKGGVVWAIIQTSEEVQNFLEKPQVVDRWYYFDRTIYRVYEYKHKAEDPNDGVVQQTPPGANYMTNQPINQAMANDKDPDVPLIAEGLHPLAEYNRCPLKRYQIPNHLWLANRAYLPILDHFNADNTLSWALFMANLAMPVIIGDVDLTNQVLSETGFIQLPEGCQYKWSEPEGKSFDISAKRIATLREEIYRSMYLYGIGREQSSTAGASSGFSKQMDFMAASDILDALGVFLVQSMQNCLADVSDVHGDEGLVFDVRGFHFEQGIDIGEIDTIDKAINMIIPSELFEKEMYRMVARKFLKDANPELFEQIMEEIRSGPTRMEREKEMMEFEATLNMQASVYNRVQGTRSEGLMITAGGTPKKGTPPGASSAAPRKPQGGGAEAHQAAAGKARGKSGVRTSPTTRPSSKKN
jgi:hypothetical protein